MSAVKSGWCTAPVGARPKHDDCRATICACECHARPAVKS